MATTFDMVNRATGGKLATQLRQMRADGLTIEEITAEFASRGYPVSRETIRRWLKRAGIPTHRVPAA